MDYNAMRFCTFVPQRTSKLVWAPSVVAYVPQARLVPHITHLESAQEAFVQPSGAGLDSADFSPSSRYE
jgi:hypothetical protein